MSSSCFLTTRIVNLEVTPVIEHGIVSQCFLSEFSRILQRCAKIKDRACASYLHDYMQTHGLQSHRLLGNHLISMLVEVGNISDAKQVFDRLVYRSESSWNSIIIGYVKLGKLQDALSLYWQMQKDEHVKLSKYSFVALLRASAKLKFIEAGSEIHAEVARLGFIETDLFIGTALVGMYADCGLLSHARGVFQELPAHNIVVWNALSYGYVNCGHCQDTLDCFEQMKIEGVFPDAITFVCCLKACGYLAAMGKGREVHAITEMLGLFRDNIFVGNSLVDMYAKCGSLLMAGEALGKLSVRDTVSWNVMIVQYVEHGQNEEALKCFECMKLDGISPDCVTFVSILNACGEIRLIDKGQQIHAEIERQRLVEVNLFVSGALVHMYAKCGMLSKAQQISNNMQVRDIVLWNTLMTGYVEHGCSEKTLECLEQTHLEGILPDIVTYVCCFKASGDLTSTRKGRQLHAKVQGICQMNENLLIGNALIDMYSKCSLLSTAQQVFEMLPVQDTVSFNALIAGYVEHGKGEEVLELLQQMQSKHIALDAVTFVLCLKACVGLCATEKIQDLHIEIERNGVLQSDIGVGNALVDTYAKCGMLNLAQKVFNELRKRDTVTWNVLIAGYAEYGKAKEALKCFDQMQSEGFTPNAVTFVACLKACCSVGALDRAFEIHAEIENQGFLESDILLGNTLLNMYAKCGLITKAQQVFDVLPIRDVASWTALMAGYAQLGDSEMVFNLFDSMCIQGIKPNMITFLVALTACSRTGQLSKSQEYFDAMKMEYGISPTIEHHTCIMDLLVRSGQLDNAETMIEKMPFCSDPAMWHMILDSCRNWGNVELAKQAFQYALCLNQDDAAAYVLMSHVYTHVDLEGAQKKAMMHRS